MKSKCLGAAVLGLAVCLAYPIAAAEPIGFYAGLRLIGSVAELQDQEGIGFSGTLQAKHDSDTVGGAGAVLGYRWKSLPIRTEIEVAHRVRFDHDSRDPGPPIIGYKNNLETTSALFNLLFQYRNETRFTPFLGGTLGWARNHSSSTRAVVGTGISQEKDQSVDNIAWGVMTGVDWAFDTHWTAEFAYRYINLGEVDTGRFAGGDGIRVNSYVSHDVLISLMYLW